MPRKDIEFKTIDHVTLRGWLYTPASASADKRLPCLIMIHGWSCLKEMELPTIAEALVTEIPINVIVYHHRGFGASDTRPGAPRREAVPAEQVSDFTDAVTYALTLTQVDPDRIGAWGYSYAGGHVITAAASDPRIQCVVSNAPVVSGWRQVQRLVRSDFIGPACKAFEADRQARARGEEPARIPVVASDPNGMASNLTPSAYAWFSSWEGRSSWQNDMTLRTSYLIFSHEPAGVISYISPRPLLMIVMDKDDNAIADVALEAYEHAKQPKQIEILRGGHYDLFSNTNLLKALEVQVAFLKKWLL